MKKRNLADILCNILLVFLLTTGATGCFISAFSLSADMPMVTLGCLVWSIFACLCLSVRRGWLLILAALILWGGHLWELGLEFDTESLLWNLSRTYDSAYDLGYRIWWTKDDHIGDPTTLIFLALGSLVALAAAWGLCRRKRIWPAITMAVLMLLPCVVVTDTVPTEGFLFELLLAVLLLALSQLARRNGAGAKAAAMQLIPMALVLALLFGIIPQDSYDVPDSDNTLQDYLLQLWEQLNPTEPSVGPGPGPGTSGTTGSMYMDLKQVGPKALSYRMICSISADYTGTIYLRDVSYETYSGTRWRVNLGTDIMLLYNESYLENSHQFITVDSGTIAYPRQFAPYYHSGAQISNGIVENPGKAFVYDYPFQNLATDWQDRWTAQYGQTYDLATLGALIAENAQLDYCLQLPETTYASAWQILQEEALLEGNVLEVAQAIGDYVRSSATYNLRTPRMPSEYEDFAIWFLQEQDTGYCVHFATAATVLLRAAGIPARYVEGYMFQTAAGETRYVYEANAHAWVEYYLPNMGWVILEATPPDDEPEPTEPPTEPSTEPPTDPSTEPPTEPSTEPTEPPTVPPTTAPTVTTPSTGDPGEPVPADLTWLVRLCTVLGIIAAALGLIIGQWQLRLHLCRKYIHAGSSNAQALRQWQECLWLGRLLKQPPEQALEELARKARFSQHAISAQELQQFSLQRALYVTQMRSRNLGWQLLYRFVLAIY